MMFASNGSTVAQWKSVPREGKIPGSTPGRARLEVRMWTIREWLALSDPQPVFLGATDDASSVVAVRLPGWLPGIGCTGFKSPPDTERRWSGHVRPLRTCRQSAQRLLSVR